jgi:hypothetical protein
MMTQTNHIHQSNESNDPQRKTIPQLLGITNDSPKTIEVVLAWTLSAWFLLFNTPLVWE